MFASGGVLSEGYGHGGPGVCLGDGQTEAYLKNMSMTGLPWPLPGRWPDGAEGVPSQVGRGDALLRRMPPIPDLTKIHFDRCECMMYDSSLPVLSGVKGCGYSIMVLLINSFISMASDPNGYWFHHINGPRINCDEEQYDILSVHPSVDMSISAPTRPSIHQSYSRYVHLSLRLPTFL